MTWRPAKELMAQIHHFAQFPQTSVSLQQMVQFGALHLEQSDAPPRESHANRSPVGSNPSLGTLLRASQFLAGIYSTIHSCASC